MQKTHGVRKLSIPLYLFYAARLNEPLDCAEKTLLPNIWAKRVCHQDLSKIALSVHTGYIALGKHNPINTHLLHKGKVSLYSWLPVLFFLFSSFSHVEFETDLLGC